MTYSMQTNEWPYTDLTEERFRAIDKAALGGDAEAFFTLGHLYEQGNGDIVKQDDYNALYCYNKACQMGCSHADMRMGKVYEYGEMGVLVNLNQAAFHYGEACSYNDSIEGAEAGLERTTRLIEEYENKKNDEWEAKLKSGAVQGSQS